VADQPTAQRKQVSNEMLELLLEHVRGGIGFFVSLVFHFLLLIGFALWTFPVDIRGSSDKLLLLPAQTEEPLQLPEETLLKSVDFTFDEESMQPEDNTSSMVGDISELLDPVQSQNQTSVTAASLEPFPDLKQNLPWQQAIPAKNGGGFQGRSGPLQEKLLASRGGSAATEDAVTRALAWIAAHQMDSGSWNFDHHQVPIGKRSPNPGVPVTKTGATGLALLPFLGKGYTHLNENRYRDQVDKGIYFLRGQQVISTKGGDLQDGTMYGHGLAAIALCEAYAMTRDESIRNEAVQALKFIEYAQHKQGGWRYQPKQAGDISVTGWQIMALKSGQLGDLRVSSSTIGLAEQYLDQVQADGGAYYGYQFPGKMISPTSIGLLSRMYMGWSKNDPRIHRGVAFLAEEGPSKTDMYYNYYATNVMCHYGGPLWDEWNDELKSYLLKTQSQRGYTSGSWYFDDQHAEVGGRLYVTCLATMILEVYYRHMPLYSEESIEFRF